VAVSPILPSLSLSDLTGTALVKRRERGFFQWVLATAKLYGCVRPIRQFRAAFGDQL
jgi:hypothetical protein